MLTHNLIVRAAGCNRVRAYGQGLSRYHDPAGRQRTEREAQRTIKGTPPYQQKMRPS